MDAIRDRGLSLRGNATETKATRGEGMPLKARHSRRLVGAVDLIRGASERRQKGTELHGGQRSKYDLQSVERSHMYSALK